MLSEGELFEELSNAVGVRGNSEGRARALVFIPGTMIRNCPGVLNMEGIKSAA